jgi:tetratricopeptide (TPR) repeat protein
MPDSAAAHLDLARFCAEHGMYPGAIAHYDRAKILDPAMIEKFDQEEKPQIIERHTSKLLANARKAIEKGNLVSAEDDLQTILAYFHETPAAEEARAMIRKIAQERLQADTQKAEKGLEEGMVSVLFKDGHRLNGFVVDATEDTVKLQVPRGQGVKVTTSIPVGKIDPHSYFEMRTLTLGSDPAAHLSLIRYSIENNLYTRAYYLYERVKALDPKFVEHFEKEELPALKEKISKEMLASAQDAMEKGNLFDAAHDLSFVLTRFNQTQAADQARNLIDQLEEKFIKTHDTEIDATVAKLTEEKKEAELKAFQEGMKLLEPVIKFIEQGRKRNHDALKKSTSSQSIKEFEAAANHFKKAVNQLDTLKKRHAEDTNLLAMIEQYRAEGVGEAVGAYINAGRAYLDRTSFKQALACADKALKVDPENTYARGFRAEVEAAEQAMAEDAADYRFNRRRGRRGIR